MLCFSTLCFRWLFNSSFLSLEQNDASIPFRQSVSHTFKPHPKACCNASILSNRYPPKYAGSSELIVTMIPWSKNCGIGEWTIDGMRCSLTFESGHTVRGIFRRANSWHRSISSMDRIPWSTRWTLRWPITARTYWGGPSSPACAHFKPHCLLQRITAKSSREGAVTPESSPIPIISPDSKYFSNPANSLSAEDSSSCRTKQTMRSPEIPNDCFACLDPAINHLPQCSMISTD